MEKKAKIIATLGPAIFSENKLTTLIKSGVDAFRINFSHNTDGINKIIAKIRKIERSSNKKIALIADLQGVKLRVGNIKGDGQRIKYNQKYIFDTKKNTLGIPETLKLGSFTDISDNDQTIFIYNSNQNRTINNPLYFRVKIFDINWIF